MSKSYLRAWTLNGMAATIAAAGGDVGTYAARFKLPLGPGGNPDAKFATNSLIGLLEACAHDLDCPDFGLRAGAAQGRDALGPIALVALHCATVGEAIAEIARYLNLLVSGLELRLVDDQAAPRMLYELKAARAGSSRQFEQWTLAVGLRMYRLIGADQIRPRAVMLPHQPLLPQTYYNEFFGCPVEFSAAGYGVKLYADDLRRPVMRNDPQLKQLISDYMELLVDELALDWRDQVDSMVRKLLPTGRCNLITVAGHCHVSVSTLQRRLREDGLVFETLLDNARRGIAEQYLADSAMRLSQVAGLLGYGSQSSLNHAFLRWHGMSPREWRLRRAAARAAAARPAG